MKKIAVLMYGHLRTYRKTNKSFFKNIIKVNKDIEFDLFMSTWEEKDVNGEKLSESEKIKLSLLYKPKMIDIFSQKNERYKSYLSSNIEQNSLMAINTSFSIINCHKMMLRYEKKKQFRYDYIILTRPDIFFNQELELSDLVNCKIRGNIVGDFNNSLFVPYILSDHYGQIMDNRAYICGIDLFCIYSRDVVNCILEWNISNKEYKGLLPEFSLSKIFNKNHTFIHYIGFEKDRAYYIQRKGHILFYSKLFLPVRIIIYFLFFIMLPIFIISGKFRQKIMFNIHLLSLSKIRRLWNFLK